MSDTYRILYLEDSAADAELVKLELLENNIDFDYLVTDTESGYIKALEEFHPDVILCDHTLPSFNSFEALKLLKQKSLNIPFVVITATMTDEVATTIVREGADDYILKDRLKRLPNVILNAIEKYRFERDRKRTIDEVYEKEAFSKETLVQLSNKLLLATKSAGMGVWDWNLVTGALHWDEGMYRIYDSGESEFGSIYESWMARLHPEDRHRVNEEIQAAVAGKQQYDTEFKIIWNDLSVHCIKANGIVERDKTGKPVKMIGVNQDITKSKEAEQAIKDSEAKYRSFFESSMDGILLTSSDGRIFAANSSACQMFQMTEEELCKAGREGIMDINDERMDLFLEERRRTGKVKAEMTGIRKNKSRFPAEVTSAQFKDANGEERNSITLRDITQRKLAEQEIVITTDALEEALAELKKIMDSSLDVICTIDGDGNFLNVSSASESVWGYQWYELIGKKYIDMVFAGDVENTIRVATQIVAGHPVTVFENRCTHKDGSIVPILWSAKWDNDTKLMYCIAKDATEKKKLEKALENERLRFYKLFYQAPLSIGVLKGAEHVYEFANPVYLDLIGKKDIIGKSVKEVLPEVVEQGFINILDEVFNTGKSFIANEMPVTLDKENNGILTDSYVNIVYQVYTDSEDKNEGIFFFTIDVTEQVQSRKKIEKSEKRFRQIVETAQEGIWTIDKLNITDFVNQKMCELIGYAENEIIGRPIQDFMIEEDQKNSYLQIERRKNGVSENHDLTFIKKCGKLLYTNISTNPILDRKGKYKGALAMITDITERKAIEENNLFKAELLKNIGQAVMGIDLNGIISYWNKASEEIFGWSAEEAVGNHIINYGPAEETKELALAGFEELFKGKNWSGELLMQRKDKTTFIACVTDSPVFDQNNKLTGIIGIASDITDRKLSEERMQEMQEQLLASQRMAHIGSWHRNITPGTQIKSNAIICSAEALRIAGFDPGFNEMTYELFIGLTHPEDVEIVTEASEKIFNGIDSYYKVEHRIITPGGVLKWVSRDAKLIKDENTKQPLKIIGTIKDITLSKEQELKLEQNSKERTRLLNDLLVRNKSLEQFAYIVSHNLRAPVANILGIAGIMADTRLSTEEKDLLNGGIIESVQKLEIVVRDLNQILEVKKEHEELKETVHFSTFVNDIKISIKHIIADDVHISCDFTAVNELFTIRSYMYSIFYNLILNSIKYRRQQIPCIIAINSQVANNCVIISFADNGMGIDLTLRRDDVFGLYKRFHTNIEGKGMGLFMVKTQVEAIGGRISLDSEINKGTTFKIEFEL